MGADNGRRDCVHCADVQPDRTVPTEGVDHGEVGGGLLHHRDGRQQLGMVARGDEQGHALHPAVLQGVNRCFVDGGDGRVNIGSGDGFLAAFCRPHSYMSTG